MHIIIHLYSIISYLLSYLLSAYKYQSFQFIGSIKIICISKTLRSLLSYPPFVSPPTVFHICCPTLTASNCSIPLYDPRSLPMISHRFLNPFSANSTWATRRPLWHQLQMVSSWCRSIIPYNRLWDTWHSCEKVCDRIPDQLYLFSFCESCTCLTSLERMYLANKRRQIRVIEVVGDDILLEELRIKDGKRSSMVVPADDLVRIGIRNNFPDCLNELGYYISPHFFDSLQIYIEINGFLLD